MIALSQLLLGLPVASVGRVVMLAFGAELVAKREEATTKSKGPATGRRTGPLGVCWTTLEGRGSILRCG
jgi:hypothetical protein